MPPRKRPSPTCAPLTTFLENHLLNWVPMLVADMRMHARTLFYQGLGQLTFGTLQEDETVLRELLDSVEA